MEWMAHLICAVVENGNESGVTCRWLLIGALGPMAGAVVFLTLWVKSLIADNKAIMLERVNDLKDHYKAVRKD